MGGTNIGGQLSQEGSEGDINLLSAGLGSVARIWNSRWSFNPNLKGSKSPMFDQSTAGIRRIMKFKDKLLASGGMYRW